MISSLYCTWSQSQKSGCFSVKFLTNLNRFSLLTSLSKGFFRRLTLLKLDFFKNFSKALPDHVIFNCYRDISISNLTVTRYGSF